MFYILQMLFLMKCEYYQSEMDFMMEAEHIDEFKRLNCEDSFVDYLEVNRDLTTACVLIDGCRIET